MTDYNELSESIKSDPRFKPIFDRSMNRTTSCSQIAGMLVDVVSVIRYFETRGKIEFSISNNPVNKTYQIAKHSIDGVNLFIAAIRERLNAVPSTHIEKIKTALSHIEMIKNQIEDHFNSWCYMAKILHKHGVTSPPDGSWIKDFDGASILSVANSIEHLDGDDSRSNEPGTPNQKQSLMQKIDELPDQRKAAANYIIKNPGSPGKTVSKAAGYSEDASFRKAFRDDLKPLGFYNKNGYRPPPILCDTSVIQ